LFGRRRGPASWSGRRRGRRQAGGRGVARWDRRQPAAIDWRI